MSKKDLLTNEEMVHAAALGWKPIRVFDLATDKWLVKLFSSVIKNAPPDVVAQHVMEYARSGDAVAIKSLQLLTGTK